MKKPTPLIDVHPDHWEIVSEILKKHVPQYEVWAFGSRATWNAKEFSDLDLAVITDTPLPLSVSASLSDAFSESDLPWKVDVVDWASTSNSFREIIERDKVVVQEGERGLRSGNQTLADACEIVMGQSPAGEMGNVNGVGLPLLNGPTEFGPYHPLPVQYTTDPRKRAKAGDLLFCVRGSTTGRMNWADRDYAIGRGLAAISHKSIRALQPLVRAIIEYNLPSLLIQATGSTFPNVSSGQLASLPWPNIEESMQRAIAHILGTLDDKIELNRKQNETLEAMARAMFKAWFVDFVPVRAKMEGRWQRGQSLPGLPAHFYDLFPDRLVESELGEIPEGWEVTSVDVEFERWGSRHQETPTT